MMAASPPALRRCPRPLAVKWKPTKQRLALVLSQKGSCISAKESSVGKLGICGKAYSPTGNGVRAAGKGRHRERLLDDDRPLHLSRLLLRPLLLLLRACGRRRSPSM